MIIFKVHNLIINRTHLTIEYISSIKNIKYGMDIVLSRKIEDI